MTDALESVLLADGSPAIVRILVPADRSSVQALFDGMREENLYTRFFTLGRAVVSTHLDHLFGGDPDVTAYVVEAGGRVIGVSDVERLSTTTAEIAFVVADDMHGRGVATVLLEHAAREAHASGVDWFTADVLAVNHEMLRVFTDVGLDVELQPEGSDVGVRMSTEPTDGWRHAREVTRSSASPGSTTAPGGRLRR